MKKKQLLTALLLISGMSITTAQNNRTLDAIPFKQTTEKTNIMVKSVSSDKIDLKNGVVSIIEKQNLLKRNVMTRADGEIMAMYDIPAGSLYTGVSTEGWLPYTALNTPVKCKPIFLNYSSETQCTWTIKVGDKIQTLDNVDKYGSMTCDPYFGTVETPVLKVVKGSASATYQLGKTSEEETGVWFGGTDITSLSGANPRDGLYNGFTDGLSFTTNKTFYNTGKKAVGFCTVYDQPLGLLYARSMYILVSENDPIPEDSSLKLKLAKLTKEGIGEIIAEAEATSEDITPVGTQGIKRIRFTFTQKDEFGFPEIMPIKLGDSPLIALFTGFDNIKMSMRFASANGFDGKSYMVLEDGSLATLGYGNDPELPQISFHVGFEGAFTYAEIASGTETAKIPNAGGIGVTQTVNGEEYNDVQLLTSISWSEDNYIILSKPDWVTKLEYEDKYWEKQGVMLFYVTGEALPTDIKGRSGKIEIDVCGVPVTINVVQGNGSVGIQDNSNTAIVNAVCDGKDIHLTYPEAINNVTIYSTTGQIITSYSLPANNFTIPATNLDKGIYLLKFNNNQTIKVIK